MRRVFQGKRVVHKILAGRLSEGTIISIRSLWSLEVLILLNTGNTRRLNLRGRLVLDRRL